jgi:hypothetical protein
VVDTKGRGLSATGRSKRLPFTGLYGAERKTILVCPKVRSRQSITVGPRLPWTLFGRSHDKAAYRSLLLADKDEGRLRFLPELP